MNFVFKFSSVLGAAALVVGCAATRPLPVAGPEDVTRGSRHFPDLTSDELVAGRALFASRCGACHAPPAPGSRPAIEWPKEIHEMRERARLSEKDMQLIERYVVTMSEGSVAKAR